jgi:outer membrane scaffolding protein for murein synthesis (MipA/OmpV family)
VNGRIAAGGALALLLAAPAAAQSGSDAGIPVTAADGVQDRRNTVTIALGGAWMPDYEGSNDYALTPIGFAFGRLGGHAFGTRGTSLYVSLLAHDSRGALTLDAGPVANLRLDRSRKIDDRRVAALGRIGPAVELGGFVAVTKNRVLHAYDSVSARVAVTQDVTSTHDSLIVAPSLDYTTPLGIRTALNLSVNAEHVERRYAQTYFGVDAAGAASSGLPVYAARGGWKNWRATMLLGQVLSGDLRNPHLSAFFALSYSRELGAFRRSPVVAIAGSPNQYVATAGLGYTF